jgi:predicted HNH restriction endonuclease
MELWGKICSNGLFDIWDPEGGPCQRFAQSNLANSRIQLLRIYEIDHEFNENDITKPANHRNIPKLILPIPEVKKIRSVITDEEFRELKELLKHSVKHYLTRPPQYFVSASEKTPLTIDTITNEDIELLESEYDGFSEGRLLIRAHKLRERNPQASIQKKKNVLKKTGTLACEVCCFDFHAIYGELGRNFAECHHRIPLCELVESNTTKLEDLAIVCANCHRMLHKARPWKTVEELKKIIKGE